MKNGAGTTQIEWPFIAAVVALSIIGLSALLQASVWLANKVIGGRESAALAPGVRRAMLIALVTMAVEFILNYLVEGLSGVRANGGELKSPYDLSKLAAYGALSLVQYSHLRAAHPLRPGRARHLLPPPAQRRAGGCGGRPLRGRVRAADRLSSPAAEREPRRGRKRENS